VMPGASGFSLAKDISLARPGIRVLFMSGYPDAAAAPDATQVPDVPCLMKPFAPSALIARVREALRG
jgi:DNA-binding NtrC family response regulator